MLKIYHILDNGGRVVYVGCTSAPIKRRLNAHIGTGSRVGKFIKKNEYSVKIIHTTTDKKVGKMLETLEIQRMNPFLNHERSSRYSGAGPVGVSPWNKGKNITYVKFGKDDSRSKTVVMIDAEGTETRFESASQASKALTGSRTKWQGNISNCCRGIQKTAYGYVFKYEA